MTLRADPSTASGHLLLDTHALVWLLQGSDHLGPRTRTTIRTATAEPGGVRVAAISIWEIGMLVDEGRLRLDRDVGEWVSAALALPGLELAPMVPAIAIDATRLPGDVHGDPADRLIIATARHLSATLVTKDQAILAYAAQGHVRALRAGD